MAGQSFLIKSLAKSVDTNKKISDEIREHLSYLLENNPYSYHGLRVTENPLKVGTEAPASKQWYQDFVSEEHPDFGREAFPDHGKELSGPSVVGVSSHKDIDNALRAADLMPNKLGIGGYKGNHISIISSPKREFGLDDGEWILPNGIVSKSWIKNPDANLPKDEAGPLSTIAKKRHAYATNGAVMAKSPAWTRKEGKNPEGGLNEKGRASLRAAGHDIKRPQPEGGSRKDSFCARMKGMKEKLTSSETANDPDSRINKSLRKWNCRADGGALDIARQYKDEGGVASLEQQQFIERLKENIKRKNLQSKTPSSSSATTPYKASPSTPSISKEQYDKGNLGRGSYALAKGGAAIEAAKKVTRKYRATGGAGTQVSAGQSSDVNDLFKRYLGRDADVGGLEYYSGLLNSGAMSLKDITSEIANSPEGQSYANSRPQYSLHTAGADDTETDDAADVKADINNLYKTYLGRDADIGGLNWYSDLVANGDLSLEDVKGSILGSNEFNKNAINNPEQSVKTIFKDVLGRDVDEGGLKYYSDMIRQGVPPSDIYNDVSGSDEAYANSTIKGYFKDMLGREPDQGGLDYYKSQLLNGRDADEIQNEISGSREAVNYANKQDIVDTFSGYGVSPSASQIDQYVSELKDGTKTLDQIDAEISRMPGAGTGEYIAPYQVAGGNVVPSGIPITPARYREFITQQLRSGADALSQYAQPILNMISQGEGGYNSMNQGTKGSKIVGSTHDASTILGKDLRDFTIGEIMKMQEGTLNSGRKLFAAGMFQIIPKTMKLLVNTLGLDPNQKFDEATQQKLGVAGLLLKPNLGKYLLGASGNSRAAERDLAQQWASFPDPKTGRSFYGGANKSGHTIPQVSNALAQSRSQFSLNFMPVSASKTPSAQGSSTTPTTAPTTGPITIPTQPGAPNANDEASQEQFLQNQGIGGDLVAPGTTSFPISGIGGGGYQDPGVFGGNYTDATSGAIAPSVPHTVTHNPVTHTPVIHTGGSHTSTGGGGSFSVGYAPDAGSYGGHPASGHGAVDPYFGHSSGSYNSSWYEQDRLRGMYGTDAELDAMKKRGGRINKDTGGAVKNALDVARAYKKGGPVWNKPRPKSLGKPTPLSSDQKSSAKAMAKAAGRPYPNLVDNMRAAKKD